jgi:tRNA 2-thiouridine synthesizing protein A
MDETPDPQEDVQTAVLLEDLRRMRGCRCRDCAGSICGHETLMSFVTGYKDTPRCLPCLARLMGRGPEELRDHLLGYIRHRPCRYAGWLWANEEEGTVPMALPTCLWPLASIASNDSQPEQARTVLSDGAGPFPASDVEWDCGSMGCGELVMGLRTRLLSMRPRGILKLTAIDPGVPEDLPAWCRLTGHQLLSSKHPEYWIQRRE